MDILVDKAIRVACLAHKDQCRKGSEVPYISHLFAVALILQEAGANKEQIIAGILHDTLEDTDYTYEELESEFGKTIAEYVKFCSEYDTKAPWQLRKQYTLDKMLEATDELKLIVCADKLHNILSIKEDMKTLGDDVWKKFGKGKESQEWYYRKLAEILCANLSELPEDSIFHRFEREVKFVFGV